MNSNRIDYKVLYALILFFMSVVFYTETISYYSATISYICLYNRYNIGR